MFPNHSLHWGVIYFYRGDSQFFTVEGEELSDDETDELDEAQEAFEEIINDESDGGFQKDNEKSGEFLQFVHDRWVKRVDSKSPLVKQYYKTFVRDEAGVDGQCNFDNISGKLYFQYKELGGGHAVFADGYSNVIKHFCDRIGNCQVLYESKVTSIEWDDDRDGQSVVNYCTSNGQFQNIKADFVVVTVSVGYLKDHHKSLFVPPLPQNKIDAINK